jgi:hypothetical protein
MKMTEEHKRKIGISNTGKKNGNWKGKSVSYKVLHAWVRRHLEKPDFCVSCKKEPVFDVANISQKYKRDLSDWEWLCRKCHMKKDGRLKKFLKLRWTSEKDWQKRTGLVRRQAEAH